MSSGKLNINDLLTSLQPQQTSNTPAQTQPQ